MGILLYQVKNIVSKLAILSLYAVFFVVQIFNSSVISSSEGTNLCLNTAKACAKEKILSGKSADGKKTNIRLNKRFHPESITSLKYRLDSPFLIISGNFTLNKPKDYLLISSILTDSLRGPPVVS